MFLVFEHTHSSDTGYTATRSTFIFVDTNTGFITTEQFASHWASISMTTVSTENTWHYEEMARVFLLRTDHMVLQNIIILFVLH